VIDRLEATWRLATGSFTPYLRPSWDDEDRHLVERFLGGGDLASEVEALESECQRGDARAFVVDSGRSAIRAALEARGLQPGDEVVLPSFSCYGVVAPVVACGLSPVLVDVDETFNITLDAVMAAASDRLRAVILPHLGGLVGRDARAIAEWAHARQLFVIEDAAQAFGHPDVGRLGDVVVYSTGVGKPLFGPGGGWLTTRDPELAGRLATQSRSAADRDMVLKRVQSFLGAFGDDLVRRGWTVIRDAVAARTRPSVADPDTPAVAPTRPGGIEAALARRQVGRIDAFVATQRQWLTFWRNGLAAAGLRTARVPPPESTGLKVWASFDGPDASSEATRCKRALRAAGVEMESAYTPLHLRQPFTTARRGSLTTTERLWPHVFMLPSRPTLDAEDRARFERALAAVRTASGAGR
jgi:dTDP-4-amino-4,6-dideoxygalactose transaminase